MQATEPLTANSQAQPQVLTHGSLAGWLRLQRTSGIGPASAAALIASKHLPETIFNAAPAELAGVLAEFLPSGHLPAALQALLTPPTSLLDECTRLADAALAWLEQPGHGLMTLADPAYPPQLLEIPSAPLLLYTRGRRELLYQPAVAVVGSRNASAQGIINAERFAEALAEAGLVIVSGLALGIDAAAHAGGLAGGASTVAVVGTGIDRLYPASNRALALRIEAEGCIVSECPMGTGPLPENFPRRNRIISGLSLGVLVMEAAARSGSLITARCAVNQGREVYAVPGSIHSTLSKGCHHLIRQGAKLVESAADVLEDLVPGVDQGAGAQRVQATVEVRGELETLLNALGHDPAHPDLLVQRTGLPTALIQGHLLALELAGLIERLPGGIFQRLRQ